MWRRLWFELKVRFTGKFDEYCPVCMVYLGPDWGEPNTDGNWYRQCSCNDSWLIKPRDSEAYRRMKEGIFDGDRVGFMGVFER